MNINDLTFFVGQHFMTEMDKDKPVSRLATVTRAMLLKTTIPVVQIAAHCDLSYPWIMRYKGKFGETEMPSVDKIERLYEYLSGKRLDI